MKRSILKRVIPLLFVLIIAIASFAITASAATTEEERGGSYGYIIPTDGNLSAQKNSYTFYGNSTKLYFMIFSTGKENSYFNIEIYSSNDYNPDNIVSSYTRDYPADKGSVPLELGWSFKSNPSGTYYGRCYTSITDGEDQIIDKSTICKFTIKINRLGKETVSLTSIKNTESGVKIKWTGLSTAVKYRIYRKTEGTSFKKLVDVKAGTTSYTDKTAQVGVQYYYTVKAFDDLYSSLCEKPGLTIVRLTQPTLAEPSTKSSVYPVIKWTKVQGCQGYYIYRKGGSLNDSTFKKIATIKSPGTLSYTDKTATSPDWAYTYTVRAYHGKFYSSYNSTGVDYNCLSAPTLKNIKSVNHGIKITWLDSNNFTERYSVYRKAEGDKNWKKIADATGSSYTDKTVKNGVKYSYSIKAVSKTNSSTYNKKGLTTMYIESPKPEKIEVYKSGNIKVFWNAVPNADGYIVYKRVNGGELKRIKKITNPKTLAYKDTETKKSGENYEYKIRAYIDSYKSYYSTPGLKAMFLAAPTVTAKNEYTTELGSTVKLTWNGVNGATTYSVLRKDENSSDWTVLATGVTEKTYHDKTAQSGSKYYYAVKAVNGNYVSNYVSTELFTVLATPILTDAINTETGVKIIWTAVTGAENYTVFRRTPSGSWENIGTTANSEYIDSSENATKTSYLYTVRANLGELKSNYMINGIANYTTLDSLDVLFEENKDTGTAHVTITWKGSNAESYEIYRSENGATATFLATVSASQPQSYIDDTITQGYTYTYTVKPIKDNKLSISRSSEKVKWDFPPIPAVEILATPYYANTELGDRIEIIWDSVNAAETYDIYRKTADTDWVYLATVSKDDNLSYSDTTIETDVIYYYSVKGISADRDSLFDDKGTEAMLKGPVEPIEDIFAQLSDDPTGNGKKIVTLAWEANENAALYKVMRKAGPDGEWEFMGVFLSCELLVFTDNTIEQGIEYTYTIHTYAPDRPSVDNMVGKTIIWPSDKPSVEDTTQGEETTTPESTEPETTVPDTSEPETTEPETTLPETTVPDSTEPSTEPTTKLEETTGDSNLDIPDA